MIEVESNPGAEQTMWLLNRSAVVVKPKQPFVDWLNKLPDNLKDQVFQIKDVQEHPHVYLMDSVETEADADECFSSLKTSIFAKELNDWCTHEPWWPKKRTAKAFDQWFEVSVFEMVIDTSKEDIEAEEYD